MRHRLSASLPGISRMCRMSSCCACTARAFSLSLVVRGFVAA